MDDVFFVELFVFKVIADWVDERFLWDIGEFLGQVATFQIENAVCNFVDLRTFHFLSDPAHEFRKLGDGAGYDEVELLVDVFRSDLLGARVFEPEAFDAILNNFYLLADRIDEEEARLGKEDRQGDPGETAACAHIKDTAA